jgi:hypothetical protein
MVRQTLSLLGCVLVCCATDKEPSATFSPPTESPEPPGECECVCQDDEEPTKAASPASEASNLGLSEEAYGWLKTAGIFVDEESVFTVAYHEGYNLHFEISEEQARSLLPEGLTPLSLTLLEGDSDPGYYLSWYLAALDSDVEFAVARIDLFTYARDQEGDLTLYFISSYMSLPEMLKDNPVAMDVFVEIFEFFARDSQTGGAAYSHYFSDTLTADKESFKVVYEDSFIELESCPALSQEERFSLDFVMANSQIYRGTVDKNVNYFNQHFIAADVTALDLSCVRHQNLSRFHPYLSNLAAVHFYGSKERPITWYYEM